MMDKISRNNYENRLKELHLNLIRSFDIGYTRANNTHYPAKKPKLMIREDNRTQSLLSYPDKTQSSNLRTWENGMQFHGLQTRNILTNNEPGRYSPISPPIESNDSQQNGSHKPITNPYLPFSVLKNKNEPENYSTEKEIRSLAPENLSRDSKKMDDDEDEGNLVINENSALSKIEENQIAQELTKKKEKSPLLYIRKPQHRRSIREFNFDDEETSSPVENSKKEESDDDQEEIIDVVSVSPQHGWDQSSELQIRINEKSPDESTNLTEKIKQPEIISQFCKDEGIELLKHVKNHISEQELNNMRLFYLNINKDVTMKDKDIENLWKSYSRSIQDCNKSLIRRSSMEIISSTNYCRERRINDEKIDFRIEHPKNLQIATNNYLPDNNLTKVGLNENLKLQGENITIPERAKEFLEKDERLRRRKSDSFTKVNLFPSRPYMAFSSDNYKEGHCWIAAEHMRCSCHRDIVQT